VASVLFLDVKGAFPSVAVDMLIHNMRMKAIPREYTEWLERRLAGRKTVLVFDDYQTLHFAIDNGLDQGDPFSGCCYLIYNSGLLKIPVSRHSEYILLFVDDAAVLVVAETFADTHRVLKEIMEWEGGVFEWARNHNCEFGIEKFQLVDFSRQLVPDPLNARKRIPIKRRHLRLGAQVIKSQGHAKFLGVLIDNTLRWKEQNAAALAKGQGWVLQFGRLAQPTKGVSRSNMRRLYLAVAVPRMLYAADVFLTPQTRDRGNRLAQKSGRAVIKKLSAVQRRAAINVTGGMGTTANDTLDVLADLLPFHLLIEKHRFQAALRLATLPKSHPLHKAVANAAGRYIKRQPTPLHYMMHEYKLHPEKIETIETTRQPNKWTPGFALRIADMKDVAEKEDKEDRAEIQIYTDGSGLEGRIGASAVLFRGGEEKGQMRFCLGSARKHTVYEGECMGLVLGLELLRREEDVAEVSVCVDSQAAIRAAVGNKSGPGHYILDEFHRQQQELADLHGNMAMTVRWTPGHRNVTGNEAADDAARRAAGGDVTGNNHLPELLRTEPLPYSKSALRQAFHAKIKRMAAELWRRSPRYQRTNQIVSDLPRTSYFKSIARLPQKQTSIITQLITGHSPLNKHLHRVGKADTPICPSCHEHEETVLHFILHCPAHQAIRRLMLDQVPYDDQNLAGLLSTHSNRKHLLNFVARTTRFRSVFGHIPELPDQE
jgi:ribonuclease HI